jgi:hypothetical protein
MCPSIWLTFKASLDLLAELSTPKVFNLKNI